MSLAVVLWRQEVDVQGLILAAPAGRGSTQRWAVLPFGRGRLSGSALLEEAGSAQSPQRRSSRSGTGLNFGKALIPVRRHSLLADDCRQQYSMANLATNERSRNGATGAE